MLQKRRFEPIVKTVHKTNEKFFEGSEATGATIEIGFISYPRNSNAVANTHKTFSSSLKARKRQTVKIKEPHLKSMLAIKIKKDVKNQNMLTPDLRYENIKKSTTSFSLC